MNRVEFIDGLKIALKDKLNDKSIQEQVNYYNGYIEEELRKGKTEQEILGELGEPWVVAKNLVGAFGEDGHSSETYVDLESNENRSNENTGRGYTFTTNSNAGCWLMGIIMVICIFIILYLVSGIFKLLSPILIPVLVVLLVIRMFKR